MGPMNDDDEMVRRPTATTPVESDAPGGPAVAESGGNGEGVEEGVGLTGMPGIEEAGYGHGV